MIGFVGSVFSPYYAHRRRGAGADGADPHDHCALNVALYGADGKRWAMTERGRARLQRDATTLAIGPSALRWDGDALTVDIDEITVPWPARLTGRVRVHPPALLAQDYALDAAGRHRWRPLAPRVRVEVAFERPGLRWQGDGYFDSNHGDVALEDTFSSWDWSRADLAGGRSAVLYDVRSRDATTVALALQFEPDGSARPFEPPPPAALPSSRWGIVRATRGEDARVLKTLEDTPFYARSLVQSRVLGRPVTAVHESLSLQRFGSRWVQGLLPFRMPRRAG